MFGFILNLLLICCLYNMKTSIPCLYGQGNCTERWLWNYIPDWTTSPGCELFVYMPQWASDGLNLIATSKTMLFTFNKIFPFVVHLCIDSRFLIRLVNHLYAEFPRQPINSELYIGIYISFPRVLSKSLGVVG